MRATRLACLVLLGMLLNATLLLADDSGKKQRGLRGPRERVGSKHPAKTPQGPPRELVAWDTEGFGLTEQEARQDAIKRARETLLTYLAEEGFSLRWEPTDRFMDGLIKGWQPAREEQGEDKPVVDLKVAGLDKAQHWQAHFILASDGYGDLVAQEREYRADERMSILGKGLAGLVALLAAVAGYFRLEEATKGYYTAWLRVGAIGFVGAVGAGLWLLS
jgi:hypothetical protein